jgi:hypothetical protein
MPFLNGSEKAVFSLGNASDGVIQKRSSRAIFERIFHKWRVDIALYGQAVAHAIRARDTEIPE